MIATVLRFCLAALLLAAVVGVQMYWPTATTPTRHAAPLAAASWSAWRDRAYARASATASASSPAVLPTPSSQTVQLITLVPRAQQVAPWHWRLDDGSAAGVARNE
ncbi:hypothetical protein JCM19000A_35700 [Silvimonas sp. JCM 19000]